jgi:polar amino acid transport system substrate-binding protein
MFRGLAFLALAIFLSFSISGQSITIYGNSQKPPKYYLQDGEPRGILVAIMNYIDELLPEEFNIQLYPWTRAYRQALEGRGGIIGLSMTRERLQLFDFSEVMYYDELLLVVRKGEEFNYQEISDLQGRRLGARRNASYGDDFEEGRMRYFSLSEDSTATERLRKLLAGRIDVALIGPGRAGFKRALAEDRVLSQRQDELVILDTPFSKDPNYLGFAKSLNQGPLLERINHIIEAGYANGEIQAIIRSFDPNFVPALQN